LGELQEREQHDRTTVNVAADDGRGDKRNGVQYAPDIGQANMKQEIVTSVDDSPASTQVSRTAPNATSREKPNVLSCVSCHARISRS
jgi:hypothetical protein